jgi:AraC-like DNA-binding protein
MDARENGPLRRIVCGFPLLRLDIRDKNLGVIPDGLVISAKYHATLRLLGGEVHKAAFSLFVYALEKQNGWTSMRRYASLIAHTVHGYLPFERYAQAGHDRMRDHLGEGTVENLIQEWLAPDINPFSQVFRNIGNAKNLAWGLNTYNESNLHPVRSVFDIKVGIAGRISWNATRFNDAKVFNPQICDTAKFAGYERMTRRFGYELRRKTTRNFVRISELARHFALTQTATCHAAEVCENLGSVPIGVIAKALGVHQRTLQRSLRDEGTTAELIIQGVRLIRATALLWSQKSLTEVAHEAGFFDLAHMDRAFCISAGVPPSFLRKVAQGEIEPRHTEPEPKSMRSNLVQLA